MATTPQLALRYPSGTDTPDGPGAFLALATDVESVLARRIAVQLGSRAITGSAWWDIPYDQFLSGQYGPMNAGDFLGIALPWAGRYSILARASISGGDVGTTIPVGLRCYRVGDGTVFSEQGQYGARTDLPVVLTDEIGANAGDVIRFALYLGISGRSTSIASNAVRTRLTVRWLGPTL